MKPAPPVTTMRRLADITRRRRSVSRGIPLFSPKSSFRWLAEQGSPGLILSSLLKDLSKVLLGQVWWSLAFRTSCWLRRPGSLPRPSVGLSRSRAAPPSGDRNEQPRIWTLLSVEVWHRGTRQQAELLAGVMLTAAIGGGPARRPVPRAARGGAR